MTILSIHNIVLRAMEPSDLDTLYLWENSTQAWEAGSAVVMPLSRFTLEQYIQSAHMDLFQAGQLRLMIDVRQPSGSVLTIGSIDLFDFNARNMTAGVGILIYNQQYRQQGYASQALALVVDYAFTVLHLHQLHSSMLATNKAAAALFTKAGFEFVGTWRKWFRTPHGWADEDLYQLINTSLN